MHPLRKHALGITDVSPGSQGHYNNAIGSLPSLEKFPLWWRQTQMENCILPTKCGDCGTGVMQKVLSVCTGHLIQPRGWGRPPGGMGSPGWVWKVGGARWAGRGAGNCEVLSGEQHGEGAELRKGRLSCSFTHPAPEFWLYLECNKVTWSKVCALKMSLWPHLEMEHRKKRERWGKETLFPNLSHFNSRTLICTTTTGHLSYYSLNIFLNLLI